ncbi:PPC domain-containing protein [Iningainema tapete]|uniref:PPC domain-containing protein n=1 Tax=Iningainema tapete BLCC-T55 TaxID=2748662 RepID=A0A8J7BXS3_9CYAN|nr:PPC domain-containing protein [Iningainema tapete]MBD2774257.1 PPC domain-containing protein [Iningainema tapete BLCC-T55]
MAEIIIPTLSSEGTPRNRRGTVTEAEPTNVYQFNLESPDNINLALTRITEGDDVDMQLYRDTNGNGDLDVGVDEFVSGSYRGGNADDSINVADQPAGIYFAQVYRFGPGSSGDASYRLSLSTADPSNLLPIETQVGDLSPSENRTFYGFVGNSDTSDVYAFSLGFFERTNIRLDELNSDADIEVIHDSNRNRIVDEGEVLLRSTRGGISPDTITLDDAGDYFLQVYQFSGDTSYTLTFENFSTGAAAVVG